MYKILDQVNGPQDLKKLSRAELAQLCEEIRRQMLLRLSVTGGHVGSNLAVIEATVALHYVFDSPTDKIIFDVSHQCYTHKLLTGRKAAYTDPAQFFRSAALPIQLKVRTMCFPSDTPLRRSVSPVDWRRDGI